MIIDAFFTIWSIMFLIAAISALVEALRFIIQPPDDTPAPDPTERASPVAPSDGRTIPPPGEAPIAKAPQVTGTWSGAAAPLPPTGSP